MRASLCKKLDLGKPTASEGFPTQSFFWTKKSLQTGLKPKNVRLNVHFVRFKPSHLGIFVVLNLKPLTPIDSTL